MEKVFIALGGNMGNVSETFHFAIQKIQDAIGLIIKQSSLYKTEPWGNKDQDYFLNQVLIIETNLGANEVLKKILSLETDLGRQREKDNQFAPRTIDIDILFYGNSIINNGNLTIPHPRLQERNFILTPLMEIAPEYLHPVFNKTIQYLFENKDDISAVEKL